MSGSEASPTLLFRMYVQKELEFVPKRKPVVPRSRGHQMKCLVPIPPESATSLKREKETGLGYQIVSIVLKDRTRFEQVVASEGCIIAVRGFAEVPFEFNQVATVEVNHRRWNFRKWSDVRRTKKSKAASA